MSASKVRKISIEDLVSNVSDLSVAELDSFFVQLNNSILGNKTLSTKEEEALLLKKIKEIIPNAVTQRHSVLQKKFDSETINEDEHKEIIAISDFLEAKSAERIYLIGALAQIRQISLPDLVKQLNLKKENA